MSSLEYPASFLSFIPNAFPMHPIPVCKAVAIEKRKEREKKKNVEEWESNHTFSVSNFKAQLVPVCYVLLKTSRIFYLLLSIL